MGQPSSSSMLPYPPRPHASVQPHRHTTHRQRPALNSALQCSLPPRAGSPHDKPRQQRQQHPRAWEGTARRRTTSRPYPCQATTKVTVPRVTRATGAHPCRVRLLGARGHCRTSMGVPLPAAARCHPRLHPASSCINLSVHPSRQKSPPRSGPFVPGRGVGGRPWVGGVVMTRM